MQRLLTLAVVFMALVGAALIFSNTQVEDHQGQTLRSSSSMLSEAHEEQKALERTSDNGLPNLFLPLAAANNPEVAIAVLDTDLNNDGNYDNILDPLAVLLVLHWAVLSVVLLLGFLVAGTLLLSLCEPPKLSSVWLMVLERPG